MPAATTITAFYTFVADTKARSSQVNNNFDVFRGHIIPIEPLTATSSHNTYDLGSQDHNWRSLYVQTIQLLGSTTGARPLIAADTTNTLGAFVFSIEAVNKFIIYSDGADGQYMKNLSIPFRKMTARASTATVSTIGDRAKSSTINNTISSGSFTTITASWISITTNGGPIEIGLDGDGNNMAEVVARMLQTTVTSTTIEGNIRFIRGDTDVVSLMPVGLTIPQPATIGTMKINIPASSFKCFDQQPAGTYNYKLEARIANGDVIEIRNAYMYAIER